MAGTTIKVKAFADNYGLTSKEVLKELAAQGYENIKTASNNIPAEDLPLIEAYFDDLMEQRNPKSALIEEVESKMENRNAGNAKTKKRPQEENQNTARKNDFGKKKNADNRSSDRPAENNSSSPAGEVHIKPPVVVKALAEAMNKRPNEIISQLMMMNVLANINQTIDPEIAVKVAEKLNVTLVIDRRDKEDHAKKNEETETVAPEDMEYEDNPKDLKLRPPIVTFMGHVDHGKTSLQDAIRKTHIAAGEAGGITQHIGASSVTIDGKNITFVDTPGHEAFTQMRARGDNVTDVVVLGVVADEGFMPQTIEAMNHALAAKVPIIVAMNKCDLPDADTQKILLHMQQNGLMSEDWGGSVAAIPVSAKTGAGITDLLERILLEAEMLELNANPKRPGMAYVLESQKGIPVTTRKPRKHFTNASTTGTR